MFLVRPHCFAIQWVAGGNIGLVEKVLQAQVCGSMQCFTAVYSHSF